MKNRCNVIFFAWSQEIIDESLKENLKRQLLEFMNLNKAHINQILYGAGTYGVMWLVLNASREIEISIKWYSIERYREYDEGNGVDIDFFPDDDTRIQKFSEIGDIFIGLPWWKWTIKEILSVSDKILEMREDKKIFIPSIFTALFNLFTDLGTAQMLHKKDLETIQLVHTLQDIKLS